MKKLILGAALFSSLSLTAQRQSNTDPQLAVLVNEKDKNVLKQNLKAFGKGSVDAKNFLDKRNYHVNLYMDPRNPVDKHSPATYAFKVNDIPEKFVIDENGKLRFKVDGFSGADEAVAEEVIQMVELLK